MKIEEYLIDSILRYLSSYVTGILDICQSLSNCYF